MMPRNDGKTSIQIFHQVDVDKDIWQCKCGVKRGVMKKDTLI